MDLSTLTITKETFINMLESPMSYPIEHLQEGVRRCARGEFGEDVRTAMMLIAMKYDVHSEVGISSAEMVRGWR